MKVLTLGLVCGVLFAGCGSVRIDTNIPFSTAAPDGSRVMPTAKPLMEGEERTISNVLRSRDDTSALGSFLDQANFDTTLEGHGPYTVFAPSNGAIAYMDPSMRKSLGQIQNMRILVATLTYHVVNGTIQSDDLQDGQKLTTINGKDVTITRDEDDIFVNGNRMSATNIEATNGVIHVIEGVLIPN